MSPTPRPYRADDLDDVVDLSLRAWAPVFASIAEVLRGSGVFEAQHPDWRRDQAAAVRAACQREDAAVRVVEVDGRVAGFVVACPDREQRMGEIHMVAVDPTHQRRGIGSALTAAAVSWLAEQGMTTVMVETGGDPGHAPARATYERAGFVLMPVSRYFKRL